MNAGVRIPSFITGLTGITNDIVASAPPARRVIRELVTFLADDLVVAHNASFDHGFLRLSAITQDCPLVTTALCAPRLARRSAGHRRNTADGVKKGHNFRAIWNRYDRLTADFVLCRKDFSIAAVIELDDRSHDSPQRMDADRASRGLRRRLHRTAPLERQSTAERSRSAHAAAAGSSTGHCDRGRPRRLSARSTAMITTLRSLLVVVGDAAAAFSARRRLLFDQGPGPEEPLPRHHQTRAVLLLPHQGARPEECLPGGNEVRAIKLLPNTGPRPAQRLSWHPQARTVLLLPDPGSGRTQRVPGRGEDRTLVLLSH